MWPETGRPRRAGVSSFGVSGTNAHVILEQPPEPVAAEPVEQPRPAFATGPIVWVLSAKTAPALTAQAGRLRAMILADPNLDPLDIGYSLIATRAGLEYRAVLIGTDRSELLDALDAVIEGSAVADVVTGRAVRSGRVGFTFPGQGGQWTRMAVELLDTAPVFADRINACEQALAPHVDWSLHDVLRGAAGAPTLDRVDVVQPVLFAVMVSLAALWESFGVRPHGVIGHSQGEIAAACVAGALSLADAARIVAVRSKLIAEHGTAGGALLSIVDSADSVRAMIGEFAGEVSISAVNGPRAVVVAGAREPLARLERVLARAAIMRWLVDGVDFVAHSPAMDGLREPLVAALADLRPRPATVSFYSTVTGTAMRTTELGSEYWFRNLREPVLFEPALRAMLDAGNDVVIEVGPHPLLTLGSEETASDTEGGASVLGSLRRDEGGPRRMLRALAQAHVAGVDVDWHALFAGRGARRVSLPTYAFDHARYWAIGENLGDIAELGLAPTAHPLLAGELRPAAGSKWLWTGSWSTARQAWLADHAVFGEVLVSGTTMVELAAVAGARVGCPVVSELMLEAPLVVAEDGVVAVQLAVDGPDADGRHEFTLHAMPGQDGQWVRHASAVLVAATDSPPDAQWAGTWPPPNAQEVDVEGWYDALAARGFGYGPAFQGLRAMWRSGTDIFAEIRTSASTAGYAVHPALLDAAFHAGLRDTEPTRADHPAGVVLPFVWSDVWLRADAGAPETLRVRLRRAGPDTVSMTGADASGRVLVSVGSVASRPVSRAQVAAVSRPEDGSLFEVRWQTAAPASGTRREFAVLEPGFDPDELTGLRRCADLSALEADVEAGAPVPEAVVLAIPAATAPVPQAVSAQLVHTLAIVRQWLATPMFSRSRLVIVTSGAIATGATETPDVSVAPVWGLVRSAQAEHPGRFVLVDTESRTNTTVAWTGVESALATAEPQVAFRSGRTSVPRVTRSSARILAAPVFDAASTVLVTGGPRGLAGLMARHVVVRYGVRSLVLACRRGPAAEGADELVAELTEHGVRVRIVACDVADRVAVADLIASIEPEYPLRFVVHAAGVLADATVAEMTAAQLERVLAAKVSAAWNLHEATAGLDLSGFVLFSSASGILGGPGQANYAAANVFLDALAQWRHQRALPAVSMAWGLWEHSTSMTQELTDLDVARLAGGGVLAMPVAAGLALFDAALSTNMPVVAPMRLDMGALRVRGRDAGLPAILHGLVPPAPRRADATADALRARLAGLADPERLRQLLQLVSEETAAVLQHHAGAAAIEPDRAFKESGFDSLAAVELRNRLGRATGLTLPPTLVFDHPNPRAVAQRLLELMGEHGGDVQQSHPIDAELERIVALVRSAPADQRARLAERLRAVQRELEADGNGEQTEKIRDATATEIFDLIDNDLGVR
ncbi:SDR family NAD(P)-dependent oxidoreductase [Nocardia halotolerans]|uniref:SDR family NAD(P)-dependent oxidoreductase n=1 Tax=Nocardia halotolerans TaxID=1755878 RepID=A0ABV8VJ04_9NOCA